MQPLVKLNMNKYGGIFSQIFCLLLEFGVFLVMVNPFIKGLVFMMNPFIKGSMFMVHGMN